MDTNTTSRTCVIIHGYLRTAPNWEHVMWGTEAEDQWGRLVRGLEVGVREDAECIFWAGGADGLYGFEFARSRKTQLERIVGEHVGLMLARSLSATEGVTTETEIREVLIACKRERYTKLVIVTDKVHIERCYKYAKRLSEELDLTKKLTLVLETSDTSFTDKESVLFEPATPYRDNLHEIAVRLSRLDAQHGGKVQDIKRRLHRLFDELESGS